MWNPNDTGSFVFQRSSFQEPVPPPTTEICDDPLYCISVNREWVPYLVGAALQLCQPSTWLVATATDRDTAVRRATDLVAEIGTAVPCTPTPYVPPGTSTPQQACNISGYLANMVIREAMLQAVNNVQQNLGILNFGLQLIQLIPGVGIAYTIFAAAVIKFLSTIQSGNLSDYEAALADEGLWAHVACAIYNAILHDGDVTQSNYPTIVANLCALSYTPTDVVTAICQWITNIGVQNLMAAQQPGVMATYTCTCTGTPTVNGPGGRAPRLDSGTKRILIAAGQALGQAVISFITAFDAVPVITPGTDNTIMLPSVASVATQSFTLKVEAPRPVDVDTYVDVDWIAAQPGSQ